MGLKCNVGECDKKGQETSDNNSVMVNKSIPEVIFQQKSEIMAEAVGTKKVFDDVNSNANVPLVKMKKKNMSGLSQETNSGLEVFEATNCRR